MKILVITCGIFFFIQCLSAEEVRLDDVDPSEAQQIIENQDQSLNYAKKIDSNVPAVRFLGNQPHHVLEDVYLARQYHGQDGLGGYVYGYNVPDIAKTEKKKAGGDLRGAYNYIAGDGQEIKVEYWDDGTGFHQIDNVPLIQPKQVPDSPEVQAAKDKFLARWHEEAERNQHPLRSPYNSQGQYASGPLAPAQQAQQPQQQLTSGQYDQHNNYGGNQGPYNSQGQYASKPPGLSASVAQQQQATSASGQYDQQRSYGAHQSPNQVDYSGQYSENKNVYQAQFPLQGKQQEDEEVTGPPRGFFYKFDYPVGIIVQKEGAVKREGSLKDIYDENRQKFEDSLKSGSSVGSSRYLAVAAQ